MKCSSLPVGVGCGLTRCRYATVPGRKNSLHASIARFLTSSMVGSTVMRLVPRLFWKSPYITKTTSLSSACCPLASSNLSSSHSSMISIGSSNAGGPSSTSPSSCAACLCSSVALCRSSSSLPRRAGTAVLPVYRHIFLLSMQTKRLMSSEMKDLASVFTTR